MKVGTSYSRCVREIYEGKVDIDDVMVIVARTDFDPTIDKQWDNIWKGYSVSAGFSFPEWSNYEDKEQEFREISIKLWKSGKIHQPRKFGTFVSRTQSVWYDLILTEETHQDNPAVKKAFEQYQMLAGLM